MKRKITILIAGLLATGALSHGAITGQWDFNNSAAGLAATTGQAIEYFDGVGGETEAQTDFGTTTSFGIPDIAGEEAGVMSFGVNTATMGYMLWHGMPANGDGFLVNQWTLIMDVLFPAESSGRWRALIQSDSFNPPSNDAELYLNESNQLGLGNYGGNVPTNTWVRLAIAVDLAGPAPQIHTYINGVEAVGLNGALDMNFALSPDSYALLFTDGYLDANYTAPGYVNSIQVHDEKLSPAYLAALGGPSAEGIPTDTLTRPFVRSVSPTDSSVVGPGIHYRAEVENAETEIDPESIELRFNEELVPTSETTTGEITAIDYWSTEFYPRGSTNTYELIFADNSTPPVFTTNTVTFVVNNYAVLTLPEPIVYEDFDDTPEGSLPAGWTEQSFTEILNPDLDLGNLDSASYATWTVVDAARFEGPLVTYSNAEGTDYQRVLSYTSDTVINGTPVQSLASGRIAFGNSGYRNGASQVLYLSTPDFDLSGESNVYLVFNSIWEQNQDSLGLVEYSIDGGETWLPVVYMIHSEDIVQTEGTIDAVATMTQESSDIATYLDPVTSEPVGGNYGDFIGVESSQWGTLAPYISGRIDDDPFDSKRVEVYRLTEADNQSQVRIRFGHAGADSWYFGIDNVGLYSIATVAPPEITTQPQDATVEEGNPASFTVAATGTGLTYQWFHNDEPISGASAATLQISAAASADAGEYHVEISNAGGTVTSGTVTLNVNSRPPAVTGAWQFNGDLTPSQGAGTIVYATPETESGTSFSTSDGTTIRHISEQPASYLDVSVLPAGNHGLHLTMPTAGNGGGDYLNQYTMVWDIYLPGDVNWTPLFNSAPVPGGNDADFYVSDVGALGIGDLGYSAAGVILPDQWYRVAFVANLSAGEVTYYLNGEQVHKRTGGSLVDGRFALYTGEHEGADVLLFAEPSGLYNHQVLVNSFLITDRALTAEQVASLGSPTAAGLSMDTPETGPEATITRDGNNITITWTDGTGPFQVQKTTSLTDPDWQNVTTTPGENSVTEAITGAAAFYRIVAQ